MMKPTAKMRSSSIVPGRRMITDQVALHQYGICENQSYLEDKTFDENEKSTILNDTTDREEREWRRQGLTEKQILNRWQERKLNKLKKAQDRLEREKFGAKNYAELLEVREYSEVESDDESHHSKQEKPIQVFAIPALPKHITEKSVISVGSPLRANGKAGLSCSTPMKGKRVSMHSFLDVSHIVAVDQMKTSGSTIHSKNIVISCVEVDDSSLQKTHTIRREDDENQEKTFVVERQPETSVAEGTFIVEKEASLQRTFVKEKDQESQNESLQNTYVVENNAESSLRKTQEQPETSVAGGTFIVEKEAPLQSTFVKENDQRKDKSRSASLQDTYVVEDDADYSLLRMVQRGVEKEVEEQSVTVVVTKDVTTTEIQDTSQVVNATLLGGPKETKKKKKRGVNNTLMNSMIEDIPSPGMNCFKHPRKKIRPTITASPQVIKNSRLSTESDKEKTIEMCSIAEEGSVNNESNGTSFVSPVSVNGTSVSPVPEEDEVADVSNDVTPKTSRRGSSINRSAMERARSLVMTPASMPAEAVITPKCTPKRQHYQTPTFASMVKNKTSPERSILIESMRKDRRTTAVPQVENTKNGAEKEKTVFGETDIEVEESLGTRDISLPANNSNHSASLNLELDGLTVNDQPVQQDFHYDSMDYGDQDDGERPQEESEKEQEEEDEVPSLSKKSSSKRKIGLLSDSIATVNTPGVRRSTRTRVQNDTVAEDTWMPEEEPFGRRGGRRGRNNGPTEMQLKKRNLIAPSTPNDEVRRSQRTRVKPVRSWLGEKAVYVNSPSGGKRLTGVTDVTIRDKRFCKYRTADFKTATEREQREKAAKKKHAENRRLQLAAAHRKGNRLNESQDDIHTDDEEDL